MNSLSLAKSKNNTLTFIILIFILLLSTFIHIWNLVQFPSFHSDEGVYVRRALFTLAGNGLLDPDSSFDHSQKSTGSFDHPFFGQIFLSSIFALIGYPNSINPSADLQSINMVYLIPRLIMGLLSILDTYLIYKISESKYNRRIAIVSSILFAVMPATWFLRRVVLDSIMLPFILTAILLSLSIPINRSFKEIRIISILAGISIGIAIFTKMSSLFFIPIIGFLIFQKLGLFSSHDKSLNKIKFIFLWFLIPALIIPSIWPSYSIITNQFDEFLDGVLWQLTGRHTSEKSFFDTAKSFFNIDPVLFTLTLIGFVYCLLRKEFVLIIWIVPYLVFLYFVGWVSHFHFISILPIMCIIISKFFYDLSQIKKIKKHDKAFLFLSIAPIVIFGFIMTTSLISTDVSYAQLSAILYVSKELELHTQNPIDNDSRYNKTYGGLTVIASPTSSWVYKYIFHDDNTFSHFRDTKSIKTHDILLLVDNSYKNVISGQNENLTQIDRLNKIYDTTTTKAIFKANASDYDRNIYPFSGINSAVIGSKNQEIRTNY